jgi:hypothetical protein
MDVAESPIEWLESCQEFEDGPYFIVSVIDITNEEAERIDGSLKGM